MKKRILGGFLALLLCFSALGCFAADASGEFVLEETQGGITINGELLLKEDGSRAETLEEAVNVPEGFFDSEAYLGSLSKPPQVASSFPDVEPEHPNLTAIEYMKKQGLMIGYEDNTFRTDRDVTRAEFIKILIEKDGGVAGVPDDVKTGFSDVDTEVPHWAYKYIYLGVQKGYLLGMGDGTFAPGSTITYEQAMKILVCYTGQEAAAKAKVNQFTALWPTAYVLTAEQLGYNSNVPLSTGKVVTRGYTAQLVYNSIVAYTPGKNVVIPSGGFSGGGSTGGGGGGGGGGGTTTERLSGVIVAVPGVCIDTEVNPLGVNDPYVIIKYRASDGIEKYGKFREPRGSNNDTRNPYASYIGSEVDITYFENTFNQYEIATLKRSSSTKTTKITAKKGTDADEFDRSKSTNTEIYYKKDGKAAAAPITLPENLDDLAVIYNGVVIDRLHPSYDHDFANDTTYIKMSDIMPDNGTVTFVNRNGGVAEAVIVEAYDTIIAKSAASLGVVTDKYDTTKTYQLDEDRLLTQLQTYYAGRRTVAASDISVTFSFKNGTSTTETNIGKINKNSVLTIYASRDKTHADVVICTQYAGTSSSTTGAKVTSSYADSEVGIANKTYIVTEYMKNHIAANPDIDDISDLFPLSEYVVAYIDSNGEIVDVVVKDPVYTYGYLVDVEYLEKNNLADSYVKFRIITKDNVSKYSDPDLQTYTLPTSGKITLDGTQYKFNDSAHGYEELADALEASADYINYSKSKPSTSLVHATYAQPIRFVTTDESGSRKIKNILTCQPVMFYEGTSYKCTVAGRIGDYKIGTSATIFSVPDDRYDYESYTVLTGSTNIKQYITYNPEVYQETSGEGTVTNNCVVLYDEGLTAYPSLSGTSAKISIIKSIKHHSTDEDGNNIWEIILYEPTGSASGTKATYYVKDEELIATNTNEKVEVGDVIMYGTGAKIDGKTSLKNLAHVLNISNREQEYFSSKFDRYGEDEDAAIPYYWFRYGTVVSFDDSNDMLYLDIGEDEPILIEKLFPSSKPIYLYKESDGRGTKAVDQNNVDKADKYSGYYLKDMLSEGDKLLLFTQTTSSTATPAHKAVYLLPKYDYDNIYPEPEGSITYTDISFSVSPDNARVTLNGTSVTATDGIAVFNDVPNGYYDYSVSADGYGTKSGKIIVRRGVETATFPIDGSTITLTQDMGTALFAVKPGNATVTINGQAQTGRLDASEECKLSFTFSPGTYSYTISAEGYEGASGSITIEKDKISKVTLTLAASQPQTYTVNVTVSAPEGGVLAPDTSLVFNGEPVTLTEGSAAITGLVAGTYSYRITAEGYETVEDTVTVGEGEENAVNVTLTESTPATYTVTVTVSAPEGGVLAPDTSLIFNDEPVTLTEGSATITGLVAGTYSYRITAEGYVTVEDTVTIGESEENAVNVTLSV